METETVLPDIEAEYIALKARQRKQVYNRYSGLFLPNQKINQVASEVLPTHEDLILATFPGSQAVSTYDLHSTVQSVKEADRLVSIKSALEIKPIVQLSDTDELDNSAEEAAGENNELKKAAEDVRSTARNVINGSAEASDLETVLKTELSMASRSSIATIREWSNIDPEFYDDTRRFETSVEAGEYVQTLAKSNLAMIADARDQLERQITGVTSTDTGFLVNTAAQLINQNQDKIPRIVKSIFGSETMNVHVTMPSDRELIVFLKTKGGKVVESQIGGKNSANIKVETNSQTLQDIMSAETPGPVSKKAIQNDRITYKGRNPLTTVKVGIVSLFENTW